MSIYSVRARVGAERRTYVITDYGPRAGILLTRRGDVLLVRQYRYLIDGLSWEIPGGKVDGRETPRAAARRECLEETGYRCRRLRMLVRYAPGLDALKNFTTVFHCDRFEAVPGTELNETVERAWIPYPRCLRWIRSGRILEGMTMLSLLAFGSRRRR